MLGLELQCRFSLDVNPFSDLTYRQQIQVFCLSSPPDPYLTADVNAQREREHTGRILFWPLMNDYFKVTKVVLGKPRDLNVFFPMRAP